MQYPIVGANAPNFHLEAVDPDGNRGSVRLDDHRGKWLVLLFYPRDFSFVCPTELTSFSAERAQFESRNCVMLGISIDDPETHAAWLSTAEPDGGVKGLGFPLASDTDGSVCQQYGVWRSQQGLPNRGIFIVDPDGILRYAATHDLAVGRNVDSAIAILDALQAGGLCPANWKRADGVLDVSALLVPNRVLGHYRVTQELGRGAFGRVLAAQDLRLNRDVALKVIASRQDRAEYKLLEEARAAAAINHPNVCTIHAVEVIDTISTIVMELIDGERLSDLISSGIDETLYRKVASGLASGLSAAHEGGIIHGDIKPANILLRESREPVLVDFGLAKTAGGNRSRFVKAKSATPQLVSVSASVPAAVDSSERAEAFGSGLVEMDETVDLREVRSEETRKISGTPAYMAPEQFSGEGPSKASDVFSLGLILCEMAAGKLPTLTMTLPEILGSIRDPRFIDSLVEQVPAEFRELIRTMLELDASLRVSATEVADALQQDSL